MPKATEMLIWSLYIAYVHLIIMLFHAGMWLLCQLKSKG